MSKGLEMMTFDIVGDLAFGETFGGVDSGEFLIVVCGQTPETSCRARALN